MKAKKTKKGGFGMSSEKKVYTVPEIQHILGLSKGSAYTFVKGNPPFRVYLIGGAYRINKSEFDAWFNENT